MEYKIKEGVLSATLNYLATRPFIEVAKIINALQTLEKVEEIKPEKK